MKNQLKMQGNWRLTVAGKDAQYQQRFIITGSANADGTYPGIVGSNSIDVRGIGPKPWILTIEHNDGSGWAKSELRTQPPVSTGSQVTVVIESEDKPGTDSEDFTDLVLRAEAKDEELIEVPFRPYAMRTDTLQMTPDGIFEAILGTYFMAVRIENTWDRSLPANSRLRISQWGRKKLKAGGIRVVDSWPKDEQEMLGQQVSGSWIELGELAPGDMRTIYIKVNCAAAEPRKHDVEFELENPFQPDFTHFKFLADQKIFVSRSGYNSVTKEFVCECDRGKLFLKLREVAVEYTTLRNAVRCARNYRAKHGEILEVQVRRILQDLIDGNQVDLCELKQLLDRVCTDQEEGDNNGNNENGGTKRWHCGDIFMLPTKFDYRVEPDPAYTGQFGPLPFDDPWWKSLLIFLAIILSLLASASAISDLAYRSDDVVIGELKASVDNVIRKQANVPSMNQVDWKTPGSVDAAIVELNGQRSLTASVFSYLDAASDEANTNAISKLNGLIHTNGQILTNAQINNIFQQLQNQPDNPAWAQACKVFKSGATTGVVRAVMAGVVPINSYIKNDGSFECLINNILFVEDDKAPTEIRGKGDSGSLWMQRHGNKAIVALHHRGDSKSNTGLGSRIEDVMNALNIRFAK